MRLDNKLLLFYSYLYYRKSIGKSLTALLSATRRAAEIAYKKPLGGSKTVNCAFFWYSPSDYYWLDQGRGNPTC